MLDCFKIIASKEEIRARVRVMWCDLSWCVISENQFMEGVFSSFPDKLNLYFLIRDIDSSMPKSMAKSMTNRLLFEFRYSLYFHYIVDNISKFFKGLYA